MQVPLNNRKLSLFFVVSLFVLSVKGQNQTSFKEISQQAGIDHQFIVYEGMFGGGACVVDINNDGWEDLYLTGGMNDDALYVNNQNGTFTNIFAGSGLEVTRHYVTQGVAAADVNKDGWTDLFVTTITDRDSVKKIPRARNLFFLNNGNSTFNDATAQFGLQDMMSFSTGVSFGDFDMDGFTDAYVGNYFLGYEGSLSQINDATIVGANQTAEGYLLKNIDGKRFENVYSEFGLSHKGFGFGGIFTDLDRDNDLDIFINHDFGYKATPNVMLQNDYPRERFTNVSKDLKLDLKINAMGTAPGDFNNDGFMDYYVTNIRFNRFMVNDGSMLFADRAKELGMDYVSISWGANFADFDNDTDLDLFVSNGDLNPNVVPMADYYFQNNGGKFQETAPMVGLNDYGIGRGSAVFDMDHDGDLDLLVVNQKPLLDYPVTSVTRLYRNEAVNGNWFKVKLQGRETDTHGIGSAVEIVVGKTKMLREIDGGSSHLSQNSVIAHFGVGEASVIDSVIVTWPGGQKQTLTRQKANLMVTVTQEQHKSPPSKYYILGIGAGVLIMAFLFYLISSPRRFKKMI